MALNKFMHSRNIYRTPPNFENMSKLFTEFSAIAKMDAKGKVTIDFKDPRSIRVLTKCLLKSDFNLDVDIPEDRLVPTLPLRLNYILWIEDLMAAIGRDTDVRGIDIGTGACAIYPLLAAVKQKWFMIGTEMDAVSLQKAQQNVKRNNLQEFVEIKSNEGTMLIENLFTVDVSLKFDFCMCNPPFYSNLQELCESRSPASVFTTMIGHKYNLSELLQDLKVDKIKHTHTEFCQGRVTRWGLAWTYQKHDIYNLVPPREKSRKMKPPIVHKLPELPNCVNNIENAYQKLKLILSQLKIQYRVLDKRGNLIALDIVAKVNTWSNQRRKKRQLKRMEEKVVKKSRLDSETDSANNSSETITSIMEAPHKSTDLVQTSESKQKQETMPGEPIARHNSTDECYQSSEEVEPLVQAFLKLFKKEDSINLEPQFLTGIGGKECLNQIVQYIQNNWK
ncbi:putative methyltransferase 10 domain containing [Operophtera brumata]|uniref:U6 small nuclear RNA (adenine-(43)-N(6))-methyltransferase n=1 Tax=Operophtera brumata TaxID=104452 RepID=A0A0L7LNZ3_OPEBR|nr:putative methyltransferase 10 domain containing [Operophtera brumata]